MTLTDTDKIRLVEQHYQSFWHGDLDDLDRQLAPSFVDHSAPPDSPSGPAPIKEYARVMRDVFRPMSVRVDDAMVDGPVVVVKATWSGRQTAEFMGHQPLPHDITWGGIVVWRLDSDGRIVERTAFFDPATVGVEAAR